MDEGPEEGARAAREEPPPFAPSFSVDIPAVGGGDGGRGGWDEDAYRERMARTRRGGSVPSGAEAPEDFPGPEGPEDLKKLGLCSYIKMAEERKAGGAGSAPIAQDNVGRKMLLRMGWSEDTGLGKDRQGGKLPVRSAHLGSRV